MPRIRTIKPEFYRHHELFLAEKESKLPIRVAFSGLWLCADKEGRFKWKPTELKLDILPYDELDFNKVLDCLVKNGFIIKYSVGDKDFGVIPTFKEHQRITGTEKQYESKIPPFNGNTSDFQDVSLETASKTNGNPVKSQMIDNQMAFQSVSKETLCWEGKEEGKDKKERTEGKEGSVDFDFKFWTSEKKNFLNGGDWIFKFCRDKGIPIEIFDSAASEFISDIELKEDYKEVKELRRHFTNWYNLKFKKNGHKSINGGGNGEKLGTSDARVKALKEW
jgi:hypothetical protein